MMNSLIRKSLMILVFSNVFVMSATYGWDLQVGCVSYFGSNIESNKISVGLPDMNAEDNVNYASHDIIVDGDECITSLTWPDPVRFPNVNKWQVPLRVTTGFTDGNGDAVNLTYSVETDEIINASRCIQYVVLR